VLGICQEKRVPLKGGPKEEQGSNKIKDNGSLEFTEKEPDRNYEVLSAPLGYEKRQFEEAIMPILIRCLDKGGAWMDSIEIYKFMVIRRRDDWHLIKTGNRVTASYADQSNNVSIGRG
jgi:hypothetical protein